MNSYDNFYLQGDSAMEYILTAAQMKESDGTAINEYGIGSLVLMERAAYETARVIIGKYGTDIIVGIMAGTGNNGGDGIAVARLLNEQGVRTEINLIGDTHKFTEETKTQLEIARKLNIPIYYGVENTVYDVIVDAIFGIGITRPVEGAYAEAIESINASNARVVAVDIPSGVNADDGRIMGCAVRADVTVTFQYRKLGIVLYPGAANAGEVYCVPIGIPDAKLEPQNAVVSYTVPQKDLRLPNRNPWGNKGSFGKVFVIAGSRNMGGACMLSALSAYRAGAGMVRVFTASDNRDILLRKLPEVIIDTYNDDGMGQLSSDEKNALAEGLKWADVVAIGPGLTTSDKALALLKLTIENCATPLVVDADALNLLAKNEGLLKEFESGRRKFDADVVFTPHLGELSRLMRVSVDNIKADILQCARRFAQDYDVTLVCKDARTVVARRGKATYINMSGNDAMATAGSGDVLTGIISGMIGQGLGGYDGAVMGVYAHGLAGDLARDRTSSYYVMAQDIIQALKELK
jgi:NAD(P)H-hydrate epimerase